MAVLQKKDSCHPSATVVIPTYNRPNLALSLAKNIRRFYPTIEIIIVDQECQNPPAEKELKKLKVKYFNLSQANTSKAKNTGIKAAKGEIVIFFDDDVELTKETIKNHLQAYSDPTVVGTAGRVINDYEPLPKHTDVETGKTNFLGTKFLLQFWSTKEQNIDFPYGCNMSFKKKFLEKVGGFDEGYLKIFEEIDLGVRINRLGKIKFLPQALVYHHKAKSGGTRTSIKNKMKIIYYHYGYYLTKQVIFPLSLVSVLLRSRSALSEAPFAIRDLYAGYFAYCKKYLFRKLTPFNITFFFVFSIIVFLRFWKAGEFFSFNFDEEYQALLAWSIVKDFHLIWIGVSASNIGFYLGPAFTYLNAFLFWLSKGDPISLAYFSSLLGIATIISIFYVVREFFSKKAAFLAGTIYGASALIIYFDRRFWNPGPIPLISIWMFYSLIKAKQNPRWFILTIALLAISFHIHLSLLVFFPLVIFFVIKQLKKITPLIWLSMISSYIVINLPLFVFDFVHNFDNLRSPLKLFSNSEQPLTSLSLPKLVAHGRVFFHTLGRLWFIRLNTNIQEEQCLGFHCQITPGHSFLIFFSVLILIWSIRKSFTNFKLLTLLSMIFLLVISFAFYPGYAAEYYLLGIYPLFAVLAGLFLTKLPQVATLSIIVLFVIANCLTVFSTTQEPYGLMTRKKLIREVTEKVGDQNFYLATVGKSPLKYHHYGGWRYLFQVYGKTPAQSYADEYFGWIYPKEIVSKKPPLKVVISEDIPYKTQQKPLHEFHQGVFYAYIFNNE